MTSRLPAEWEPQSAILLTWPHSSAHWGGLLPETERLFIDLIRYISDDQKVIVSVHDETTMDRLTYLTGYSDINLKNLDTFIVSSNDCWARDHGPITIYEDNTPILLDFGFNGWNYKYPHELDNRVTRALYSLGAFGSTGLKTVTDILEGGSIETNGIGCLFTTASCLLQHNRNPGHDRDKYESLFSDLFGCEDIIWLEHGRLAGDDTDGHIDTLLRFCSRDTIIYQQCNDINHMDFISLYRMEKQLLEVNNVHDHGFTTIPVPVPDKTYSEDGKPLPASYVNFIITNKRILLPVYGDKNDNNTRSIIRECFPDREVIAIDARPLIQQYGSLHCTTMQLPGGVIK